MNKPLKKIALTISLLLSTAICIADTTMVFDTITSYKVSKAYALSSISGIEKDSGNSITANFSGARDTGDTVSAICTPLVLTAMEKSGRYFLHVSWSTSDSYKRVQYCTLELKSLPE